VRALPAPTYTLCDCVHHLQRHADIFPNEINGKT
jgi:hypothetical protein